MKKIFVIVMLLFGVLMLVTGCNQPTPEPKIEPTPEPTPFVTTEPTPESTPEPPLVYDGSDMEYHDEDYRTQYANVFDFDSYEGQPYFAVAFLGYGDRMEFRNTYVSGIFESLSEEEIDNIRHFDFEGDEWYLVIPRYKNSVDIMDTDGNILETIPQGEAFTVRCNVSDIYSNIVISAEYGYGAHQCLPQMGGDGRLVTSGDVWDITDYSVTIDYMMGE